MSSDFTFAQYQEKANETAKFKINDPLFYCIMGTAGEAGETLEKAKKIARESATYEITPLVMADQEKRVSILLELGDQLWYIAQAARLLGSTLEEVAIQNNKKLEDRNQRNVIVGEGDKR